MAESAARRWYFTALAVASVAIALQVVGKRYAGRCMMTMARSAEALSFSKRCAADGLESLAIAAASESESLKQAAFWYAHQADVWGGVSAGLALVMAAYWAFARFYRPAGDQKTLLALFGVYVLLFLVQV